MARIRTIKPEFWEDEKIAKLPIPCRLFFIGTWNFADDQGVFRGNAAILKSRIFPYDETITVVEISKWLEALVKARMIIPVRYNEESYFIIRTFLTHQVIDKRYLKTTIPGDLFNSLLGTQKDHVENTACSHSDHLGTSPQEMEMEMEMEMEQGTGNKYTGILKNENPEFQKLILEWLDYKKGRKETYKSKKSILAFIEKIKRISKNDPVQARKIIEDSMANNWAGFFEPKPKETNGAYKTNSDRVADQARRNNQAIMQRIVASETGAGIREDLPVVI